MKKMMMTAACGGFTLVELLAAMTSASLVALAAGIMLYHVHRARQVNQDMVDAQQDGSVAMIWLARAMRDGTNVDLRPLIEEEIDIATTGGVRRIYVDAGSRRLCYEAENGSPVNVTTSRVVAGGFTYSNVESGVGIRLALQTADGPREQETVFYLRNR